MNYIECYFYEKEEIIIWKNDIRRYLKFRTVIFPFYFSILRMIRNKDFLIYTNMRETMTISLAMF